MNLKPQFDRVVAVINGKPVTLAAVEMKKPNIMQSVGVKR